MDGSKFDRLTCLVTQGRSRRSALGLIAGGLALGAGEVAARERLGKRQSRAANPGMTDICHYAKGADKYVKITVADRSLPAHLAHGDSLASSCDDICESTEHCENCDCICNTPSTGDGACEDQKPCGGEEAYCATLQPIEGGACFCHQGSSCGALSSCTATSDCPKGWACANSCCGEPLCVPPCGTVVEEIDGVDAGKTTINR